jgi:hypothetical protein
MLDKQHLMLYNVYSLEGIHMAVVHLLFDTETLGLYERAVVTTLACTAFSFEGDESYDDIVAAGFFTKFKGSEQVQVFKRETTASTLAFWKQQTKEAQEMSILPRADDVTLVEGLTKLTEWIESTGYDWKRSFVWCRGNAFDFPKIESLFADANMKVPFNTWKIRDTRTMIDCLTGSENGGYNLRDGEPKSFIKHHALHDAALDCARMKEIYRSLNEA